MGRRSAADRRAAYTGSGASSPRPASGVGAEAHAVRRSAERPWFVSALGSVGEMFVQFLLTVAIAAVMYTSGERAAATVIRFGRRLAGDRGEFAVRSGRSGDP